MSELTLVIGNKNYSSWSLRPWIFLKHLGIDFEEILVPLQEWVRAAQEEVWTNPWCEVGQTHGN
ncbi:MAG TPA: hypothetical protein VJQ47_01615 [Steroidobacteraceae bacterium]|nr:hypothetical protein [Steroidobacteraceae bacterium]